MSTAHYSRVGRGRPAQYATSSEDSPEARNVVTGAYLELSLDPRAMIDDSISESEVQRSTTDLENHDHSTSALLPESINVSTEQQHHESDDDEGGIPGVVYKTTTMAPISSSEHSKSSGCSCIQDIKRIKQEDGSLLQPQSGQSRFNCNAFSHLIRLYCGKGNLGCWIAFYTILSILPFAMIILGALNINDCPRDPKVAIYLVVEGLVTLILLCVQITDRCLRQYHQNRIARYRAEIERGEFSGANLARKQGTIFGIIYIILVFFLLIWFVCGTRFVADVRSVNAISQIYCSPKLINIALGFIVLQWVLLLLFILFLIIILVYLCVPEKTSNKV